MLRHLATAIATLAATGSALAKVEGDVQIAWLGGGGSGGAEWIVSRPAWSERDSAVSGAVWGLDAAGRKLFVFRGVGMGKRLGHRLARVGDVDGDGCSDFVACSYGGAWQDAPEVAGFRALNVRPLPTVDHLGSVRCISGRDGHSLWVVWSRQPGDRFGEIVSAAGDFDGDGSCDVAVGRSEEKLVRSSDASVVWLREQVDLYSGMDGRLLYVFDAPRDDSNGSGVFGAAVAGGSDLDGDGRPELAVSAPLAVAKDLLGRIEVFDGRSHQVARSILGGPGGLAGRRGPFGEHLEFVPDLDGDGIDEIAATVESWRVELYRGATLEHWADLESPMIGGTDVYSGFGSSIAVVGDVDGDERLDLLVGCREQWPETKGDRYDLALFSGCDGRRLALLPALGRHSIVTGARRPPWDVLIAFPTQERALLVREDAWRRLRGARSIESLGGLELELD